MARIQGKALVKKFALAPDKLDELMGQALGADALEQFEAAMQKTVGDLAPNAIVKGKAFSDVLIADLDQAKNTKRFWQPTIPSYGKRVASTTRRNQW